MMAGHTFADGFSQVDNTGLPDAFSGCLRAINGLDSTARYKRRSDELLRLKPGLRVLDGGSGLGEDVFRIAEQVLPDGLVMGVDSSRTMTSQALSDPRVARLPVRFLEADISRLPFGAASFDRVRIDRVLQHCSQPLSVLGELTRVLTPGGILVAVEPDWGSYMVDSAHLNVTQQILMNWCNSFKNGCAGRRLPSQFAACGLENVAVEHDVLEIRSFEEADKTLGLRQAGGSAAAAGLVEQETVDRWVVDLQSRPFYCALVRYLVSGTKRG